MFQRLNNEKHVVASINPVFDYENEAYEYKETELNNERHRSRNEMRSHRNQIQQELSFASDIQGIDSEGFLYATPNGITNELHNQPLYDPIYQSPLPILDLLQDFNAKYTDERLDQTPGYTHLDIGDMTNHDYQQLSVVSGSSSSRSQHPKQTSRGISNPCYEQQFPVKLQSKGKANESLA